jgi:hypothetical protein
LQPLQKREQLIRFGQQGVDNTVMMMMMMMMMTTMMMMMMITSGLKKETMKSWLEHVRLKIGLGSEYRNWLFLRLI